MLVFHDLKWLELVACTQICFLFSSKLKLVFESFHYIILSSSLKSWPSKINDFVAILGL